MIPLAHLYRPKELKDIIGQEHITGENKIIFNMIKNNKPFSIIISGPPGVGKTTIANVFRNSFNLDSYYFNASSDNKEKLKSIIDKIVLNQSIIIVIDEIHRIRKDTQDYLLNYLENGLVIIIGLTTENPYYAINPAIRSRCHIVKLNPLSNDNLFKILSNILNKLENHFISKDNLDYIINISNKDARFAINVLETIYNMKKEVSNEEIAQILLSPNLPFDNEKDNYYDLLSAFQKSIRGSDVNASLHYLARLILLGDIDIILRRMLVIAYEDVGLASPSLPGKVLNCIDAVKMLGMPEARIPLANLVVELAIAPKSNSAYIALDKAIADIENGFVDEIPKNILNKEIRFGNIKYLYPHDYKDGFVKQNYRIERLKNTRYYEPKETSSYEKALKDRYEILEKKFKE